MSAHVMNPRPPLRALAVAAGLAVAGVGFFMAPDLFGWSAVLRGVGLVLLAGGLAILVLALVALRRMRVEIVLDDDGFQVAGPAGQVTGRWDEVTRVTRANQRVILYRRDGKRTVIALPHGGAGDLDALGADIAGRLDVHRGYGRPVNLGPAPEESEPQAGT